MSFTKDFEGLNDSKKIERVHVHILNIGKYTSDKLDAAYFDKLPQLDEISEPLVLETLISEKSFLNDDSVFPIFQI